MSIANIPVSHVCFNFLSQSRDVGHLVQHNRRLNLYSLILTGSKFEMTRMFCNAINNRSPVINVIVLIVENKEGRKCFI